MIVSKTKYLEFKSTNEPLKREWHYVRRTNDSDKHDSAVAITTIVKLKNGYNFLFLKTCRPPIYSENKAKYCLESPAGLIGDEDTNETLTECIKKELMEEAGYQTDKIFVELKNSSTSAGLSSETLTYATAIVDDSNIISKPIDDNGVIIERVFVPADKVRLYLSSLDNTEYSISAALVCGVYFALNRIS